MVDVQNLCQYIDSLVHTVKYTYTPPEKYVELVKDIPVLYTGELVIHDKLPKKYTNDVYTQVYWQLIKTIELPHHIAECEQLSRTYPGNMYIRAVLNILKKD
jgi:hypothetical protein